MIFADPGRLALILAALVAIGWAFNEWDARGRAALTPAEREAEDAKMGER